MSVINKMLRDLDQRAPLSPQARADQEPARAQATVRAGTSSVAGAVPGATGRHRVPNWLLALVAALLVSLSVAVWWWQKAPAVPVAVSVAVASPPMVAAAVQVPVAVAVQAKAATATPAPAPAPSPAAATAPSAPPAPARAAAPIPARTSAPAAAVTSAAPTALVHASPAIAIPAATPQRAATVVATPTAPAVPEPQAGTARQLQAGRDALAQAQAQWNAGSHDAATELLQAAVASVERSNATPPSAAQTQLLAALVRELARMQLAEGRAAAALETLARQEPQLGREADIWAMRGNAAQRLGKHQDSVQAYATALQLRPNEPRWMLGSAVSLAALGQTANAAEMADKARALGPISKEVQAYLRLAGVRLTEP